MAKWRRSSTHLLRSESFAPDTVLMRVVQRIGMGLGLASRDSRKTARRSACFLESAGTWSAAESALRGSNEFPAISLSSTCSVRAASLFVCSHGQTWGAEQAARRATTTEAEFQLRGPNSTTNDHGTSLSSVVVVRRACADAPSQAAHNSQGIQTLLEAEKDAATIVQGARQCG